MQEASPHNPLDRSNSPLMQHSAKNVVPRRSYPSRASDLSLEVFGETTPELGQNSRFRAQKARAKRSLRADSRDSTGPEPIALVSGTAEQLPEEDQCCPSLSRAWGLYRDVICYILTCGHRLRKQSDCYLPCLRQEETANAKFKGGEINGYAIASSPNDVSPKERNGGQGKSCHTGGSFSYPDVKLKGIPVYPNRSRVQQPDEDSCCKDPLVEKAKRDSVEKPPLSVSQRGSGEYYSFHEPDLDNELTGSMSSTDIDILIFKKLTELFSLHQIDELAKCTSDTVFLEKTNKISDLISSITQDYNLDEQDAECRLVRGIIRISTRKSRTRPPITRSLAVVSHSHTDESNRGIQPDSGNETMVMESTILSQDDLNVQISEETSSDVEARNMRPYSAPGSPTGKDDSFQDTETDSSGAPLLKVYC
ncbi:keratinocyte differentiation factor 1 [Ambystoma mexicanum]|uniref:keratinocyte differentiation factor 1 n=1 Tax=Ambystoma mexicanum TaxID=8296 RepID=UPI0037E9539A